LPLRRIGDTGFALRQRLEILVAVAAVEDDNIARAQLTVVLSYFVMSPP